MTLPIRSQSRLLVVVVGLLGLPSPSALAAPAAPPATPTPCEWLATGPVPNLIPGAEEQRVVLSLRAGDPSTCTFPAQVVLIRDDGARLTGALDASGQQLLLARVPASLAVGSPFWSVEGTTDGKLELPVEAEPLAVRTDDDGHPIMNVHYSGIDMNGWHSGVTVGGVAVTTPSAESDTWVEMTPLWQVPASIAGELAVDPAGVGAGRIFDSCVTHRNVTAAGRAYWNGEDKKAAVEEKTRLALHELAQAEQELADAKEQDGPALDDPKRHTVRMTKVKRLAKRVQDWTSLVETWERHVEYLREQLSKENEKCELAYLAALTSTRHWRVEALTWKGGNGAIHYHLAGNAWRYGWTMVGRLSEATFATSREERAPLEVAVELYDTWPQHPPDQRPAPAPSVARWLRLRLKAADAALEESLPLPVADALSVRCGKRDQEGTEATDDESEFDRVVNDTEMRGIRGKHLRAQGCRLFYDPQRFLDRQADAGAYNGADRLRMAGRQQLTVRVSRTGATAIEKTWVIDDPTQTSYFPLEVPQESTATGHFTVEARITGGEPPAVRYRPAPNGDARGASDATVAPADRQFTAYLRPITRGAIRGRRAEMGARVFATIPFDPLVVRFPARPDGLPSSTSDTGAQVVSQRIGVAFVVEPWNFDTGRNPAFIRFETGSYLFTASDQGFDPSYFVGIKGAFPLLNLPDNTAKDQLGTDLTIGLLLEVPYTNPFPYLLMTVGFDVLSLLGSK